MDGIIAEIIEKFALSFFDIVVENPPKKEEQLYTKGERLYFGIHCNYWQGDILKALSGHCFETHPLSVENFSNWLLRYAHALCEYNLLNRPTIKLVHELETFRPEDQFLETIEKKQKIRFDLYHKYLSNSDEIAGNCHKNFKVLLEIEDVEILREFVPLVQYNKRLQFDGYPPNGCYKFYASEPMLFKIKDTVSPGIDEIIVVEEPDKGNYTLLEILIPHETEELELLSGTVKKYSSPHVHFQLENKDDRVENLNSCDLVFRPSRISIRYQQNALQLLQRSGAIRNYLCPEFQIAAKLATDELTLKLINNEIATNREQLDAVMNIVKGPNPQAPYIIFGPPGTGKTTTIVESMIQLRLQKPESRILVAAGSNAACDTIAIRLCEIFDHNEDIQEHLKSDNIFPMLRIYSKSILLRKTHNIPEELQRRSNLKWCNGEIGTPSIEWIHRYGIVIATLCTVGKLVRGDAGKLFQHDKSYSNYFTHVFIDEAAASSEPEALIGVMGIKNGVHDKSCHVILSGDHKQLGPVIKSDEAKKLGLDKSLMERLLESDCYAVSKNGVYDRSLQMRLRQNYRSHPEIVRLYNHLYYNNELIAMKDGPAEEKRWSVLQNTKFPIAFQVVHGVMQKKKTNSSSNTLEIRVLCAYVRQLLDKDNVKQLDIGVVTPYKLQCERIKDYFKARNWQQIEVGSVENYQGREKPIIIASMVRSNQRLGFVRCPRRLNVLLSRPKSLLIILGDPETLSGSDDLQYIINECKINGNYLEENKMKPEDDDDVTRIQISKKKEKKTAKKENGVKSEKTNKKIKGANVLPVKIKSSKVQVVNRKRLSCGAVGAIVKKTIKENKIKSIKHKKETISIKLSFLGSTSNKKRASI